MIERSILCRCDRCLETSDVEDLAIVTEPELRRDLKERGWRFDRNTRLHDKIDLCPTCANGGAR